MSAAYLGAGERIRVGRLVHVCAGPAAHARQHARMRCGKDVPRDACPALITYDVPTCLWCAAR
jgi:hypothetical protein